MYNSHFALWDTHDAFYILYFGPPSGFVHFSIKFFCFTRYPWKILLFYRKIVRFSKKWVAPRADTSGMSFLVSQTLYSISTPYPRIFIFYCDPKNTKYFFFRYMRVCELSKIYTLCAQFLHMFLGIGIVQSMLQTRG